MLLFSLRERGFTIDKETRLYRRAVLNTLALIGCALTADWSTPETSKRSDRVLDYVAENMSKAYAEFMNETEEVENG